MSLTVISRGEWCRALGWDSSPVTSARVRDVLPLCQAASDSAAREQHLLCASSALCVQRASQSSASCAFLKYPGGCTTSQVKAVEATAHPRDLHPGPSTCVAGVMALQLSHLFILRLPLRSQLDGLQPLDTLGFEPRAFRMRSGCDTTTPCAHGIIAVVNSHNHWPHRCPKAWLRAQDSSHPRGRWAEHTPKSKKLLAHPRTTNVSVASLASW